MSLFALVRTAAFAAGLALSATAAAKAETNMLFILDASNSMWGQDDDGVVKIESAKKVLETYLSDLPSDTKVGLMAYGHRVKGDCNDVETLVAIGGEAPAQIVRRVKSILPKGKTPIAGAIQASAANFTGLEEENNNVVLISDGIESCDGDPCGEAGTLVSRGINVKVHVVGFDVDPETRAQLECIAEKGKGRYFDAENAATLMEAMVEIQQVAQAAPEPEPTGPIITEVFRDDFDGEELADHWEVQNPAPDAFIVEDGHLLLLSSSVTGFHLADMPNLMTLNQDVPRGDWDINVTFSGEMGTGHDWLWIGLRKDEKNFLASLLFNNNVGYGPDNTVGLRLTKHAGGKETKSDRIIVGKGKGYGLSYWEAVNEIEKSPAILTLSRRKRSYFAAFQIKGLLDENGDPHVLRSDQITSLRSPGELTLGVGLWKGADGEFLALVDSIQIVTVEE